MSGCGASMRGGHIIGGTSASVGRGYVYLAGVDFCPLSFLGCCPVGVGGGRVLMLNHGLRPPPITFAPFPQKVANETGVGRFHCQYTGIVICTQQVFWQQQTKGILKWSEKYRQIFGEI